jgi:hypothetical protein
MEGNTVRCKSCNKEYSIDSIKEYFGYRLNGLPFKTCIECREISKKRKMTPLRIKISDDFTLETMVTLYTTCADLHDIVNGYTTDYYNLWLNGKNLDLQSTLMKGKKDSILKSMGKNKSRREPRIRLLGVEPGDTLEVIRYNFDLNI